MLKTVLISLFTLSIFFYGKLDRINFSLSFVTVAVTILLINLKIYSLLADSLHTDFQAGSLAGDKLNKNLFLFILWICSLFFASKVNTYPWIADQQDQATLLFFSMIPFYLLFNPSVKSILLAALLIWIYASAFVIFKFETNSELFSILAFWFFSLSVFARIKEYKAK